jgi:hypothetical protein
MCTWEGNKSTKAGMVATSLTTRFLYLEKVTALSRPAMVAAFKTTRLCTWQGSSSAKAGIGGGF